MPIATGFDAAQHEAKVQSDRRAALALEEIGVAISGIAGRFSGIEARMETEAVDVAISVARKLCSELIAGEPLTEMMALVHDCFKHLVQRRILSSASTTSSMTRPANGSRSWPSRADSRASW